MICRGKVVILTGASSGIGEATAHLLVQKGAKVVLAARNKVKLELLESKLKKKGGDVLAVPTDITSVQQVKSLVARTLDVFKTIDILINNAGIVIRKLILNTTNAEIQNLMNTNFFGSIYCTQEVLPILAAKKEGHIVNMISLSGIIPFFYQGFYCASKFALAGFTQVLEQELKDSGVLVSCVFPGLVDTPLTKETLSGTQKKILKLFSVSADFAAAKIVQAIEQEKKRVLFPCSARMMRWVHFLSPSLMKNFLCKLQSKNKSLN